MQIENLNQRIFRSLIFFLFALPLRRRTRKVQLGGKIVCVLNEGAIQFEEFGV